MLKEVNCSGCQEAAPDKPSPWRVSTQIIDLFFCVVKIFMFQRTEKLASMPKYEQIPQKSNTHKTEVLHGRTTPSGGALVLNPAQCGLLAQSAWWDNPRLDKMLDYHSVFQEDYTFARSFFQSPVKALWIVPVRFLDQAIQCQSLKKCGWDNFQQELMRGPSACISFSIAFLYMQTHTVQGWTLPSHYVSFLENSEDKINTEHHSQNRVRLGRYLPHK